MDLNKLKGKLREYGFTYSSITPMVGMSLSAFRDKISYNNKREFKPSEISKLRKLLNLTDQEVIEIFFD